MPITATLKWSTDKVHRELTHPVTRDPSSKINGMKVAVVIQILNMMEVI